MGPMFTDFLGIEFTHLGGTSPYIYFVKLLPPALLGPSFRGTQIILISYQFMEYSVMRISQPNCEKSVGKGQIFEG